MPLNATDLGTLISEFWQSARNEWTRLTTLQKKMEGKLLRTWMPDSADLEYKDLFRKASSPWPLFARNSIAQGCRIEGYSDSIVWRNAWQASGMDGRQVELNRDAIGLGYSYLASLPHASPNRVVMRPMSSLVTFAAFEDPYDESPKHVLHLVSGSLSKPRTQRWMFIDSEGVYRFEGAARTPERLTFDAHGLTHCPVARIENTLPVLGSPKSSIEDALPVYQRIVDATFTLQMVQRYGAFPQKWMAGGEIATDANGVPQVRSSVDGLLHASGASGETARFGTFTAADLPGVVTALNKHIQDFSALVQVPPHSLLVPMSNISGDTITASESGYKRNIRDRQTALGEGYELAMRNAGALLGVADETLLDAEMAWADESTRSLDQVADAVVKLASVDAPLELLFGLVPGWSRVDALDAADEVTRRRAAVAAGASRPALPPAPQNPPA
ncbi:phage portal protein [Curtobacterium sp. MCSS17_015]|uniref:phage portal protein n=1 Tax=Curtobacterium sp. MCSS17_015 TaxID=2175666 RepID=UPI000DA7CA3A|nr:phage portal protein [Curtobacterium sp. MCSS17_015]WIB25420.1 phage portal protein [Curtobacterium sp. MCSS17_015]